MYIRIVTLFFLLNLSCSEKQNNRIIEGNIKEKIHFKNEKIVMDNVSQPCNKDFDTFFKKFSIDSIFQKRRIKYPLEISFIKDGLPNKFGSIS